MSPAADRRLLMLFARILEYPQPDLAEALQECAELTSGRHPKAGALLREFSLWACAATPGALEEAYTRSFDLAPTCYPYVGYHLFGESYKRSVFMLKLKELYRAEGFACDAELPDHLAVLLRFLAACGDDAVASELIQDALLPTLEKMAAGDESGSSTGSGHETPEGSQPAGFYGPVLSALRLVIERDHRRDAESAERIALDSPGN